MRAATLTRGGFTLVELMIGMVFTMAVSAVAYRLLLVSGRVSRAQVEYSAMQDNIRAGALIVASELRELGFDSIPALAGLGAPPAASSDILLGQPGRIRYRAMRGLGFTCLAPAATELRLQTATYLAPRWPEAGIDSVSIFVEGDPSVAEDDAWIRAAVTGQANSSCGDGTPAVALTLAHPDAALGTAALQRTSIGAPVRIFEVMEIQYYRSEGRSWLGMRSVSRGEIIQPLLGPLADSAAGRRGFTLAYLDENDVSTAAMSDVRSITIGFHGVTDRAVWSRGGPRPIVDSLALTTRVALRNALRP